MILVSASPAATALALGAAVAYATPAVFANALAPRTARVVLFAAWLLHAALLVSGLWGPQPRFGFAPALSVTAWLVLTVYMFEEQLFPQLRARWALAAFGVAAVVLTLLFPGTPMPSDASPLLALHGAFGLAAGGMAVAAVLHAWLMRRAERDIRRASGAALGVPLLTMERLTFRFVAAGFALLSATLAAGLLFGETLYGRGHAWQWNHKTVFTLLAWIVFAVLVLGRLRFGWRGRTAVRVLYAGSAFLLLAYVGSRFVLEVVLGRTA